MRRTILIVIILSGVLAGCNFSTSEPEPTPPPTRPVNVVPTIAPSPTPPPTETPLPTHTPTITPIPSATPTATPYTPTAVPPTPTTISGAYVCPDCRGLRLRQSPGSAGAVQTELAANTPLNIIGRTADNVWVQVVLPDGRTGWVAAQFVDIVIDLNAIEVTGTAEDAPVVVANAAGPEAGSSSANNSEGGGNTSSTTNTGYVASNVISGITSHSRQIYLAGQARGNRATVFSKVGDSISYSWAYMFGLNSDYNLGSYSHLQPAIGFFSGPNGLGTNPFSVNPPIAALPGWTSSDVLKPGNAKVAACGGDSPLVCAYNFEKPSVALIMLGTNDAAQDVSAGTFEANMQQIIDLSISMGVIPVLSTIPPFPVKDANVNAYNQVIRALARANDVPLVDYWAAINNLPNRGLSGDGVHPSEAPDNKDAYFDSQHLQYGFNVLNLGRLQVLYELWRQVLYDGGSPNLPDNPPPPPAQPTTPPVIVDSGAVDPATYSCPGTLPIRLTVGGQGRVTPGAPNKLRSGPGISHPHIGNIPAGGVFNVTGGPVCADGYTWWKVSYNGQAGWTASGSSTQYWVEPG